jgi:hypothetical protein
LIVYRLFVSRDTGVDGDSFCHCLLHQKLDTFDGDRTSRTVKSQLGGDEMKKARSVMGYGLSDTAKSI